MEETRRPLLETMIPDLLPYHSYDPDGRIFVQADGSLGLAWDVAPLECETHPEDALGQLARRIELLLALFPEGSAAQFLCTSSRNPDLEAWRAATTEDGLFHDLAEARVRATRSLEIPHEGSVFVSRTLRLVMTLRTFPSWRAPTLGEGLRYALGGAKTIEEKFRRAYAQEKAFLLRRAEAIENLLTQTGLPFRRLDLEAFRALVHTILNPGRSAPLPADDGQDLLCDRLAFTHAELDGSVIRLGDAEHYVLSAREFPRETWAGMLPLESFPDGAFVFNIDVCPAERIRKFLAAKKRLAFCQLSGGDDKVDVSSMKEEIDQISAEIFREGARVYAARLHAITRTPPEGAVNALSHLGLEMVAETSLAGSLFLQTLPLAYDPANDRMLKRGRRAPGLNLAHLLPFYGAFRGTPSPDLLLVNRRGEPVTFSFFDSTVAPHGIIAGVSGSGKSVLANNLILSAARRGARVFVLDRGNSYRKLCEMLGGTYVAFDPNAPQSINPCGSGLDEDKKIFLTDIVSEMCSQGQRELTVKERSLVARAVLRAF